MHAIPKLLTVRNFNWYDQPVTNAVSITVYNKFWFAKSVSNAQYDAVNDSFAECDSH